MEEHSYQGPSPALLIPEPCSWAIVPVREQPAATGLPLRNLRSRNESGRFPGNICCRRDIWHHGAKLNAVWGMDDRAVEKRQGGATADSIDRNSGKGSSSGSSPVRSIGHGAGRNDNVPRGILCMVVATILFSAASAASKWLVEIYPVGEVLCLRSLASL